MSNKETEGLKVLNHRTIWSVDLVGMLSKLSEINTYYLHRESPKAQIYDIVNSSVGSYYLWKTREVFQ